MKTLALALAALLGAGAASAETLTFGTPLSGTGPTTTFATLNVTQTGSGDDWQFTLTAGDLTNIFGSANAFIGSLAIDAPGAESFNFGGGLSLETAVGGGVGTVTAVNGGGPGGAFDFRLLFGGGNDRLTAGESVSFSWQDSGITTITDLALHVQGLDGNANGNSSSVWYSPGGVTTPVPEPATLAMLAAGLGVLGWKRRRA
jgi:hypothetical protein